MSEASEATCNRNSVTQTATQDCNYATRLRKLFTRYSVRVCKAESKQGYWITVVCSWLRLTVTLAPPTPTQHTTLTPPTLHTHTTTPHTHTTHTPIPPAPHIPALMSPWSPPTNTVLLGSRRGEGQRMELLSERAQEITCTSLSLILRLDTLK